MGVTIGELSLHNPGVCVCQTQTHSYQSGMSLFIPGVWVKILRHIQRQLVILVRLSIILRLQDWWHLLTSTMLNKVEAAILYSMLIESKLSPLISSS